MATSDSVSADGGHLSIGEVLSQLRVEFPDVTISKIRFLEGQGLIDPERTPSGYRKFFEADIVRLVWILRQQRDHFLPLKVIKAKLDHDANIDFTSTTAAQPNLWSGGQVGPDGPSPDGIESGTTGTADGDFEPPWSPAAPQRHSSPTAPGPTSAAAATSSSSTATVSPDASMVDSPEGSLDAPGDHPDEVRAAEAQAERDAAAWLAALQESPRRPSPEQPTTAAEVRAAISGHGLRFGLAEVIEVTGVEQVAIDSLISFGLVAPVQIGGEPTFDASSVAVIRAAAVFLTRGVESRHLRIYKNAAEREAGFYEQMILPLLKQRNPKARERATEDLAHLAAAGDELHRALVRQALRTHFND